MTEEKKAARYGCKDQAMMNLPSQSEENWTQQMLCFQGQVDPGLPLVPQGACTHYSVALLAAQVCYWEKILNIHIYVQSDGKEMSYEGKKSSYTANNTVFSMPP